MAARRKEGAPGSEAVTSMGGTILEVGVRLPREASSLPDEVVDAIKVLDSASRKVFLWHEFRILKDNVMYTVSFHESSWSGRGRGTKRRWAKVAAEPLHAGRTQVEVRL